jgi:Na+/melibiose symporter-like transporter
MEKKSSATTFQKISWGFGGLTENLSMNVIPTLAYNIFQIGMGISPFVISLAMSASKIVEAVSDPVFGSMSDNTRTRFGRRRPWIFFGAIIISLVFVSIWFTPRHVSDHILLGIKMSGSFLQASYFIGTISLFFIVFAIWQIPFSALGLELEEDYAERTKLQTIKVIFSYVVGTAIGSLYLITQMKGLWGGDEITGARGVGVIVGIAMLIFGIWPAIFCRERYATHHEKIAFWPSFIETFKDKPFKLLMGAIFFVFVALFFMLPLLNYISMYYVCRDGIHSVINWSWRSPFSFSLEQKFLTHKELAGYLGAYGAVVQTTTQILSVLAVNRVSKIYDKRTILLTGLTVAIIGYASSWFLFNPNLPFLSILPPIIINIGLCACWVLIGSFTADICDYDELRTGKRREGMYSAVTGFLIKLSIALVGVITGWALVSLGIGGSDPVLSEHQMFTLRYLYVLIPVTSMLLSVAFIWKYPLTKVKVKEIQKELNDRKIAMA